MYLFIYLTLFFIFLSLFMFFMGILYFNLSLIYMIEFKLFILSKFYLYLYVLVDWMSLLLLSMIMYLFSMIIMFSFIYFKNDKNLIIFVIIMLYFVLSMMLLILMMNLYYLLFSWDFLGLMSFFLIIYYNNILSLNNSLSMLVINRLSDISLILSMLIMFMNLDYYILFNKNIMIYLVMAYIIKSAQFPYMIWLPLAMSAPVTVSSLVHSSTLVIVGVYEIIRFSFMLQKMLIYYLSLITLIYSFFNLINLNDMKVIMAYSTMNHISMMIFLLSKDNFELVYLYLLIHALFKSSMFMCLGILMMENMGSQDMRFMGMFFFNSLILKMMIMNLMLLMSGFPFFILFYCKDMIIDLTYSDGILFILILSLMMITSIYGMKLMLSMMSNLNLSFLIYFKENKIIYMSVMMIYFKLMMYLILISSLNYWNLIMFSFLEKFVIILILILIYMLSMELIFFFNKMKIMLISLFYIYYIKNYVLKMIKYNLFFKMMLNWIEFYLNIYFLMNIMTLIKYIELINFIKVKLIFFFFFFFF